MRTDFSLPFDGRVVDSQAEVGQFLNQGQKFGEVFDVASIEALVPISPRDLLSLKPAIGRRASLSLGDFQLQATIARVSPTLDERTRFAQIYLALDNATDVYPGSFFNVVVEGPRLENTILLPEAAEQINESVWVVRDNKLKRSQPRFINRQTSGVIVESFDSGDGVVLGRVPGAKEGMMVKAESG
jgi:multidrug efflux pump subunit AcrA (membrane-fusion protein)